MRIAFLFGAGISIPAGMPTTEEITNKVISGEGVAHNTDDTYFFGKPLYAHAGFPDKYVPKVVEFIKRLKVEVDQYYSYRKERPTNYEELYYVASQIYESEFRNYDNPAVQPLIDKIYPDIKPLLKGETSYLTELSRQTNNYIADVVWCFLGKKPIRYDHLNSIKVACQDNEVLNIDIFTLNHDTVVDNFLFQNAIPITDGFGEDINKVRYWNPDLFETSNPKIRLFKLHGSINWFLFASRKGNKYYTRIGMPLEKDIAHTKDTEGNFQNLIEGRPIILTGTFNKMLEYMRGIFIYLHYQFYNSLPYVENLIICGYSFGDKGINTRIIEWMESSQNNKLVVVNHNPEKLKNMARLAITKKWDNWLERKKLEIIEKKIEDTSWQEVKEKLE